VCSLQAVYDELLLAVAVDGAYDVLKHVFTYAERSEWQCGDERDMFQLLGVWDDRPRPRQAVEVRDAAVAAADNSTRAYDRLRYAVDRMQTVVSDMAIVNENWGVLRDRLEKYEGWLRAWSQCCAMQGVLGKRHADNRNAIVCLMAEKQLGHFITAAKDMRHVVAFCETARATQDGILRESVLKAIFFAFASVCDFLLKSFRVPAARAGP
jgi:hypothetical protein